MRFVRDEIKQGEQEIPVPLSKDVVSCFDVEVANDNLKKKSRQPTNAQQRDRLGGDISRSPRSFGGRHVRRQRGSAFFYVLVV